MKFIFYTDCPLPEKTYANTEFKSISYGDYCKLVSKKLGIDFAPTHPYKLCDLRPFFAVIHEEDIAGYDFWSYGDIDVCLGDLRVLLNEENLARFDLITTQDYHLAGHFSVFRNNEYFRNACFGIPDWKNKLLEPHCIALDELDMTHVVHPSLKYPKGIYNKVIKRLWPGCYHPMLGVWNRIVKPRMLFKMEHTSPEPKKGEKWVYDMRKGEIYKYGGGRLPYLHFLFFKDHPDASRSRWGKDYYKLTEPIDSYSQIEFTIDSITGV